MEPVSAAVVGLAAKYLPELIGLFSGKDTKAAKAASVVGSIVQEVTGTSSLNDIDKALASQPELVVRLREAVMKDAHIAEEMRLADVANARAMQVAALQQDDKFSKRFVYYFAMGWSIFCALYFLLVSFIDIPQANMRIVDTLTGVLIGTVIVGMFQYFYGSSERSRHKDDAIRELSKQKGA